MLFPFHLLIFVPIILYPLRKTVSLHWRRAGGNKTPAALNKPNPISVAGSINRNGKAISYLIRLIPPGHYAPNEKRMCFNMRT